MKIIIVLPCYNEEAILEKNIKQVAEAARNLPASICATRGEPHDIRIVISDNNSKDRTAEIGKLLARELPNVDYIFTGEQGKGAAVMEAWKKLALDRDRGYDADIYGFMDTDLATDLEALQRALKELETNDAVIGSRRIKGAEVEREPYRKLTSAGLNFLIRLLLKTKIKDTPCGFKFFRKAVLDKVLPQVKDRQWVFDTEMLILAERGGYKIKEMSVKWAEKNERGSRVSIYPTAMEYLKKILEIRKRLR